MEESSIDAERLAALLDGRLDERQREELLARLASDEAAFEAFAEALAVTRALEAEDAAPAVVPFRTRSAGWWQRPVVRGLAVAAGLAALVAIPWATQRTGDPAGGDPVLAMARLGSPEGLPAAWNGTPWSVRRSRGQAVTSQGRSIRAGARLVDLEIAAGDGDAESTSRIARDLSALLDGVPAAGPVAAVYETIHRRAAEPHAELETLLEQGRTSITTLLDEELVRLGAWVEAARLAAARQDEEFFQAAETRAVLESAIADSELTADARAASQRVLDVIRAETPPSWPALDRELTTLLQSLASG